MSGPSATANELSTEWVQEESDYDLIEMVTWGETDRNVASRACSELYNRHSQYLIRLWSRNLRGLPSSIEPEDVVNDTFVRLFCSAARSFKRNEGQDSDGERRHVRMWLGVISKNIVMDLFRNQKVCVDQVDQDVLESFPDESAAEAQTPRVDVLAEYARLLNDKEQAVLRVVALYHDIRNPNQKIPTEALNELSANMGITRENFRQIKKRAIAKLHASGLHEMLSR